MGTNALATGVALVGGLSNLKGNVYFQILELGNGVVFALPRSIRLTPTPSAHNLGFPEPESSTAPLLVVVLVATSLVLCPIPSESSSYPLACSAPPLQLVQLSRL